jgi:hypothetical protein
MPLLLADDGDGYFAVARAVVEVAEDDLLPRAHVQRCAAGI